MNHKKQFVWVMILLCMMSLACSLGSVIDSHVNTEQTQPETIAPEPTEYPDQTATIRPERPDEPVERERKGQIAFNVNGNVWYQNLETGELQQLTFDADSESDFLNVYRKISFSDSGRFLAYQYGYHTEGTLRVSVVDLSTMQETARLEGEMLVGWRYDEDVLLVGHGSHICDYNDPSSYVEDETISFILSSYDVDRGRVSPLLTIHGGNRFPISLTSRLNYLIFQECPCEVPMCFWIQEVFSADGEAYEVAMGHHYAFSTSGNAYIPISYSIYEPETDGLWIHSLGDTAGDEIYREDGKFVTGALWSPDDAWIVLWLGDVVTFDFYHKMIVTSPDGNAINEITPTPKQYLGWFSDGRLMVIPADRDQIILFDPETGETAPLAQLEQRVDFEEMVWSHLP